MREKEREGERERERERESLRIDTIVILLAREITQPFDVK